MAEKQINQKKNLFSSREEEVLNFWDKAKIFEKSIVKEAPRGNYIFYEGPPTANGAPGIHHILARAFKDIILKYRTMKGYRVERKAGWDTHGLPVEIQVEKELGISGKSEIEKFGVEEFNKKWNSLSSSLIDQIEALNEVASTFSDLASNNTFDREKIDIVQLIGSAIDIYKNHEKVTIRFKANTERAYVLARPNELLRVFNNLIKNAVQAILPNEGEVEITIFQQENIIEIKISDNGRGIPEEMKNSIFQPYFTTKSGGTGVGLAIVKNILTEMGGEITFVSREGEGTEFTLHLRSVK